MRRKRDMPRVSQAPSSQQTQSRAYIKKGKNPRGKIQMKRNR